MSDTRPEPPPDPDLLRLWPGILIVLLQWAIWMGAPRIAPGTAVAGVTSVFAGWIGTLAVVVWWTFFSRAGKLERWGAPVLMAAGIAITPSLLHESVARGNVGMQYYIYMPPLLSLAFVAWAVATRGLAAPSRRTLMLVAIVLGTGGMALTRSDGLRSDGSAQLAFRWAATAEERLLAGADAVAPGSIPATVDAEVAWPGFRGPGRRSVLPGVRIETDWSVHPPQPMWRRPVGPGTSSFAVAGRVLFTQEQRGDHEVVAAYSLETGEPIWRHRDRARVEDSYVGAGPRATPAVGDGRVYTLGATGILNALDARDGSVVWSRNAAADADAARPEWGFVASPLVLGDQVLVYTDELASYEGSTGRPRWHGPDTGHGYGSPQLSLVDGVPQVLLPTNRGAIGVAPGDGTLLWEHSWPGIGIVQPVVLDHGEMLISMIDHMALPIGTRRIAVERDTDGWSTEERWTTNRLKPSFSSPVAHGAHAYGFDGHMLTCLELATGQRVWKGGRYGHGQLILLPDQDLLLVLTERGGLALVSATPEGFRELARAPAIEGKTWSHPALVGDLLLVRNGLEMAAFRLRREGG